MVNNKPEKLSLYNRDGVSMRLELKSEGYYTLEVEKGKEFWKEHLRVIGNNPEEPNAIDPPGGPYIEVDSTYLRNPNNESEDKYYYITKIKRMPVGYAIYAEPAKSKE